MKKYKIGYTTGVFDMFHIGHLNLLRRAKEQCEVLIVGVSTDELVREYKHKTPVIPFAERKAIVEAIRYVDQVVTQENMDKREAVLALHADAMFVGSDWQGTAAWNAHQRELAEVGCEVVYLPYTAGVSSTLLTQSIKQSQP